MEEAALLNSVVGVGFWSRGDLMYVLKEVPELSVLLQQTKDPIFSCEKQENHC